jgi:SAM-dependent methyltransferase
MTSDKADPIKDADLISANRDLWDGWAELHFAGKGYDVESFKAGRETLDAIELEGVGEVQGKSLLHLQCHFGMDTLNWARRGARVAGVDFSEKAIGHARRLARELDLEARFFVADVTDTAAVMLELDGEQFDVVFTSHGTICWLPDLRPWARTVAAALRPGGRFFIADSHPFCWMFDDERREPALEFRYEYFGREALRFDEKGSYAEPDSDFEGVSYSWQHPFAEIVSALAEAGLTITSLKEYPYLFWQWFPWMVREADGSYHMPAGVPEIPIMFSLAAVKR